MKVAYADFDGTPASGPIGNEIGTNASVQIKEERFIERTPGKDFAVEIGFGGSNAFGKEWG
jgi:hypothetical protein